MLNIIVVYRILGVAKEEARHKILQKVLHASVSSLLCLSLNVHINREAIPYAHKEKWLSHVLNLYEICLDISYV